MEQKPHNYNGLEAGIFFTFVIILPTYDSAHIKEARNYLEREGRREKGEGRRGEGCGGGGGWKGEAACFGSTPLEDHYHAQHLQSCQLEAGEENIQSSNAEILFVRRITDHKPLNQKWWRIVRSRRSKSNV